MNESELFARVAVVGAGLVGSSWAAWFAAQGIPVRLFDIQAEALRSGRERATAQLAFLRQHGRTAEKACAGEARMDCADSLAEAVAEADLVVEAVAERYEVKIPLFRELDQLASPRCTLASSSSGLLISRLQAELRHPERVVIAHPFNPVHLVPLVELVAGDRTSPDCVESLRVFLERHGKTVVVVRKEIPGYIGNRLQAAVWREAIQLVLDGVGSVEDVDRALTAGPGMRWALMGQHRIFHLGGGTGGIESFIDHIGSKWGDLWTDMASWSTLPPETRGVLSEGIQESLGDLTTDELVAWRDEQLARLQATLSPPPPQKATPQKLKTEN